MKGKKKKMRISRRKTLQWRLTFFVLCAILLSSLITFLLHMLLLILFADTPLLVALTFNPLLFTALLLLICTIFATLLSGYFSIYYLRPIKRLIRATEEVKKGNFKVSVESEKDSHTEMGTLVTRFNEMVRELDGIELFRNDFINNFSHEFKTPIVSIRGFARELERGGLSEAEVREYANIIAEEADRLARLSTNVLELSKLENQQLVTDKSSFYLDEQLRQALLLLEPLWTEKALEILPELEEIEIYANEELLAHVWNNLLSNAIKFTPQGGSITVSLSSAENSVSVSIRDTGIGMSEEVKNHIFEKFYQGDPSHHRKGYGIGLTMAERAVKLSQGSISVESVPGEGSTFTVTLPREAPPTTVVGELQEGT